MKILEFIPSLNGGGAEKLVYDLSLQLAKKHQIKILTYYDESSSDRCKQLIENGIEVLTLGKKTGVSLKSFFTTSKIIKKFKPDIIHTHLHVNFYTLPYYFVHKKQIGFHTVHNIAEKEQTGIHKKITNWLYHNRKVTPVAIGDIIAESIVKEYKIDKKDFPLIYNGIDLHKFSNNKNFSKVKNFIAIGRLSLQKNYSLMLEAFSLAITQYPDLTLTVLGAGDLAEQLNEITKKLGLEKVVNFVGNVSNVYEYIFNADCMIMSSDYEGLPLSMIECIASGLPIISTNVGSVVELVKDNENGFLCDAKNVDALAKCIVKMVNADINLINLMSQKSKEISQQFDITKCSENYEKAFEGIINY